MKDKALKVVLVLFGVLFVAGGIYGVSGMFLDAKASEPFGQMLASIYGVLGIFMLLAARHPAADRSLIGFIAWSSVVHGGVMGWQATHGIIPHSDLLQAVLPTLLLGVLLLLLAPGRRTATSS